MKRALVTLGCGFIAGAIGCLYLLIWLAPNTNVNPGKSFDYTFATLILLVLGATVAFYAAFTTEDE